jgi:hypothetical protein
MADGNFDNVSATGNILADGYISAAGNVTAEGLLFNSPTTANISVGNIGVYDNLNMSGTLSTSGNVTAARITGNLVTGNQPNITNVGTLSSLTVSGNATSGNVLTSGVISSTGNARHGNVTAGIVSANTVLANAITFNSPTTANIDVGNLALYSNLNMTGAISTSGNITGARFIGNLFTANQPNITNVGTLTSLTVSGNATAGNVLTAGVVSSTGNATHGNVAAGIVSANAVLTNTITFNSPTTANISVGNLALYSNLNMTGSVSAAGNIRGNYFLGNGYYLTGISGVASTYGNSNVAAYLPTYTGNLTANVISTTGNITGSYIFGNGSQLTGITTSYGNANTAGFLANFGSNTISTTGSISAGDVTLNNLYSPNYFANAVAFANATGYITTSSLFKYNSGTEVLTVGAVSATGNITANYFVGNGSQLTDLPAGYSNADVSTYLANSNVVISTTGNITGSYILGNGSQLTGLPSGSGNTGNVTFDDVNIIGTGNLNLQPNGASNEYLNIYLTGNADIHVAAGGGVGNVILGTDEQANVAVLQDGNVAIQAGNVSGTKTWNFDITGNLTLPLNSVVYETNIPDGGLSGSAIALKPTGGTNADQQLLIYPTTNDANHLHLTSGNLYSTELFFGSDNLYVKLANTGNVVINSNDGIGNSAQWTFDTTGNLTLPGNTFAVNYANGTQVSISGGNASTGNVTFDNNIVVGTGDEFGGSGLYLAPGANSSGNLQYIRVRGGDVVTHIHLDTGNNAYFDQYFGDDGKYVKLANTGNIEIRSDDATGNAAQWTFDTTGNLTLPGNTFAVNYANGTQVSIGGGGNTDWANIGNINNVNGPTKIAVGANAGLTTQGAYSVAVGESAGSNNQGYGGVAVGNYAGSNTQGDYAVAIGADAGQTTQGAGAVAIGKDAGTTTQGEYAVAIGQDAGTTTQGEYAVAVGPLAGTTEQGALAVAVGTGAGETSQGTQAVAIGYNAGRTSQGNNSIILNATGANLNQTTANTFTVAPVRNDVANIGEVVFYNTASKEITYGNTINVTGNVTGGNISTGGTLTATGKIGYASGSTVTQLTSRGTGVIINTLAGTIITTSAAMVATEIDTFSVTNSSVDPNSDIVLAQIVSPNQGTYNCIANPATIGGFNPGFFLNIVNISGFTTSDETITIRFMIIKAPNA